MRLLALDLGGRRTGTAVSDPTGALATPLEVLDVESRHRLLEEVERVAGEYRVEGFLIGHPLRMDGRRGPEAQRAEAFAAMLRDRTGLPVVLWDERLTTVQAERMRRESRGRKPIDSAVAALILQEFLDVQPR